MTRFTWISAILTFGGCIALLISVIIGAHFYVWEEVLLPLLIIWWAGHAIFYKRSQDDLVKVIQRMSKERRKVQ